MNLQRYLMIKSAVLYTREQAALNQQRTNGVLPENVNPEYRAELQKLTEEWNKAAPIRSSEAGYDTVEARKAYLDAVAKHNARKQKDLDALNAKYGIY